MGRGHFVFLWTFATRSFSLLFLVLAFGTCSQAHEPQFQPSKCWFNIPRDRSMTCGHLLVPENREREAPPLINLAVAIFEPDLERHEPVVFLTGGPGQSTHIETDDDIKVWWQLIAQEDWLRGRRLVVVDPRGVGLSQPALDCSKFFTADTWQRFTTRANLNVDFEKLQKKEVQACRDALLAKGVDLPAYNTQETAADVNDLRLALGIPRWVLYGVSYGTEVALQAMDEYPNGISAGILDSVLPTDVDYLDKDGENLAYSLRILERDCLSAKCLPGGHPIGTLVETIVDQLNEAPVLLRDGNGAKENIRFRRVSGDDFLDVLFDAFYDRGQIEMLPFVIQKTFDQDYRPLAKLLFELEGDDSEKFFDGLDFSVTCTETGGDNSRPHPAGQMARSGYLAIWNGEAEYSWICPLWIGEKALLPRKQPRRSDIPVLFLSGEYDPATPSHWAKHAAAHFTAGQVILFRGIGHDVIDTDACGSDVVSDFLANPERKIETDCLAKLGPPDFITTTDDE